MHSSSGESAEYTIVMGITADAEVPAKVISLYDSTAKVQKALDEAGDKLDSNDKSAVESDLNALKSLIDGKQADSLTDSDIDQIKAAREKLMESAQKLFAKLYESQQANAAGSDMGAGAATGAGTDNGAPYGDDVVDGDYKEV